MMQPLVSIVTPSFTQGPYIEQTILSVYHQEYPFIEHIVIDGGSTDETLSILRKYPHLRWTSEPDRGQAHAVNKGFAQARGSILGWLNSDDLYMPGTIAKVVQAFETDPDCDLVYSHCLVIDELGRVIDFLKARPFSRSRYLQSVNFIPQPTVFFRRSILDDVGYLDESLQYAMDYDFWLRIAAKHKVLRFCPDVYAAFRVTPSTKTSRSKDAMVRESFAVFLAHGGRRFSAHGLAYLRYRLRATIDQGRFLRRWSRGSVMI